ncbi:MAG: hypothetical protein ACYSU0_17060 [Planctomycetota bacterium]|jgi:hypothetical protein
MGRRVVSAGVVALLAGAVARGAEWKSEKHKCAITYPDGEGWQLAETPPAPRVVFAINQTEGPRAVLLTVTKVDDAVWLNDAFIRGFEKGAMKAPPSVKKVVKLSSRKLTVAGVPAYEIVVRVDLEGSYSTMVVRGFLANGVAYGMNGVMNSGEAAADEQILKIMSSFRFTSPPKIPKARDLEKNLAYRVGQLVGGALVVVVILLLLKRVFRG